MLKDPNFQTDPSLYNVKKIVDGRWKIKGKIWEDIE